MLTPKAVTVEPFKNGADNLSLAPCKTRLPVLCNVEIGRVNGRIVFTIVCGSITLDKKKLFVEKRLDGRIPVSAVVGTLIPVRLPEPELTNAE